MTGPDPGETGGFTVRERAAGWLALLRVPNLFSVPGDAWAGMALAGLVSGQAPRPSQFVLVGLVSLCLYGFGLVLNDLADLAEDRITRPERPLVRGTVTRAQAMRLLVNLLLAGLLLAGLVSWRTAATAGTLALLVAAYDLHFKRCPPCGFLAMGLCRGASLLVGASVAGWPGVTWVAAAGLTGYIAAVTGIAAGETTARAIGPRAWGPLLGLLGTAAGVWLCGHSAFVLTGWTGPAAAVVFVVALVQAARLALRLGRGVAQPGETQAAIGRFIRLLIPWQAAYLLLCAGGGPRHVLVLAVTLLVFWPLAGSVGRRVAGS